MKIEVLRKWPRPSYTIGEMYVDGVKLCNTLEDIDRGLTQSMPLDQIKKIKVPHVTAIPKGTYNITLSVQSPKYSKSPKMMAFNKGCMPRLLNVPGYEGVLVHPGNTTADTDGCILVGVNNVKGKVTDSFNTFTKLYKMMKTADAKKEKITITIK